VNWFRQPNPPPQPRQAPPDPRTHRGDQQAIAVAVAQFLTRTGLFDRDHYVGTYPDVTKSGLDPLHHYMRWGIQAGFSCASRGRITRLWREVLQQEDPPPAPVRDFNAAGLNAAVYVSSAGNFFMKEIADMILCGLQDAGVQATLLTDKDAPLPDATHHIVVAPHEFFVLGEGPKWANDAFVTKAIMYSTEQVQTTWFARSLVFLLRARAVADLNPQTAAILRKGGIKAFVVQPGHTSRFTAFAPGAPLPVSRAFDGLPPDVRDYDTSADAYAKRPLDLLFLGSLSPKREKRLAAWASRFASLNTFIYATRVTKPLTMETAPTAQPAVTAALLQRSKLLLNIHRDEYTFLEWWRLMQAFWQKTLVVTEPCFPHPVYKPGIHYLEEAPRHIPNLVEWLVHAPDGHRKAEEIRTRAFKDLTTLSTARAAAIDLLRAGGLP
jgi:hypothetical protein